VEAVSRPFEPDWTLHPGVCLREILDDRGITPERFAADASLDPVTVGEILAFTAPVTAYVAQRLETALGGPSAGFWLNYQANYERGLARGAKDVSREDGDGEHTRL
jgi:addiction module HigA family antidote